MSRMVSLRFDTKHTPTLAQLYAASDFQDFNEMAEDGMFNMLRGIKEKSADQETRMRNMEVRNKELRRIQNEMLQELDALEFDQRDRQILINKLYNTTIKTMGVISTRPTYAPRGPSREAARLEIASAAKDLDAFVDDSTARKARENAERRARLRKPYCFKMRSAPGGCQLGAECPESHDVIPVGYCRAFNDTGHCDDQRCRAQHTLYNYTPTEAELATAYAPRETVAGDHRDSARKNDSPDRRYRSRSRSPSPRSKPDESPPRDRGSATTTRKRSRDFFDKREDRPGRNRDRDSRKDRDRHTQNYSSDESFERERKERRDRDRERRNGH